jgi:hypothetical protein
MRIWRSTKPRTSPPGSRKVRYFAFCWAESQPWWAEEKGVRHNLSKGIFNLYSRHLWNRFLSFSNLMSSQWPRGGQTFNWDNPFLIFSSENLVYLHATLDKYKSPLTWAYKSSPFIWHIWSCTKWFPLMLGRSSYGPVLSINRWWMPWW